MLLPDFAYCAARGKKTYYIHCCQNLSQRNSTHVTVKCFFFVEVCLGKNIKEMDHARSKKDAAYEEYGRTIDLCIQ